MILFTKRMQCRKGRRGAVRGAKGGESLPRQGSVPPMLFTYAPKMASDSFSLEI